MFAWPLFLPYEVAQRGQNRILIPALSEAPASPTGTRDVNVEEEISLGRKQRRNGGSGSPGHVLRFMSVHNGAWTSWAVPSAWSSALQTPFSCSQSSHTQFTVTPSPICSGPNRWVPLDSPLTLSTFTPSANPVGFAVLFRESHCPLPLHAATPVQAAIASP